MILFAKSGKKLTKIPETGFSLESELQHLIDENMNSLLEIDFVKSELTVKNFRIDTVGFDPDSKAFVIVEYKRDKNHSIIDQGTAYLSLLLENKAEFILAYNEKFDKSIRKEDVNWSQSRVVFIARSFTLYQKQASGFRDLPIELYEIRHYKNKTVLFNPVTVKSSESVNTVRKKKDKLNTEIKTYTEENHLEGGTPETRSLYAEIREIIKSLDDEIRIVPKKKTIMFKVERGFAWVVLHKNSIKITVKAEPDSFDDPKNMVQDVTNIGHWGGGNSRIRIKDSSEMSYLRVLLEQAYSKFR